MLPRVFAVGAVLGTACVLLAQAVSPQEQVTETSSKRPGLQPITVPFGASVDLSSLLAPNQSVVVTCLVSDLEAGEAWTAIDASGQRLAFLRVTGAAAPAVIVVSTEDAELVMVGAEDLVEVILTKEPASNAVVISINGQPAGAITDTRSVILHGLGQGTVYISPLQPRLSEPREATPPNNTNPSGSYRDAALAEFDRLKTTRPGRLVLKDNAFVPFEHMVDAKRGTLAALMTTRTHCVFLDWELGDDSNDGLKAHTAGKSGHGPKRTWQAAMAAAQPGGVLVVSGGVYSYDEIQHTPPKDLTLIPLGSVIMNPASKRDEMLASGFFKQGAAGLEITSKYLNISAE